MENVVTRQSKRSLLLRALLQKPHPLFLAMAAGCLSLLVVFLRMRLWNYDLRVPISYWGDSLYLSTLVKALTENGWNFYIPRLGAPFGMETVDFPLGCNLDFAIIKLLSIGVSNPFLLINLYWLLTIGLSGAFACLFFRSLHLSRGASICFGTLYAIIPFVFFRNIAHLDLVSFIVPVGAYLATSLAQCAPFQTASSDAQMNRRSGTTRTLLFGLCLCVVIGFTFAYWAFFTSVLIFFGCLIGWSRYRNKATLAVTLAYLVIIAIVAIANISPSLVYWYKNGTNTALAYKSPAETDVYGLRIRQMLTPIPNHPFSAWRAVNRKMIAAHFQNDANETMDSALGTLGSIGFLLLVCAMLVGDKGAVLGDSRMRLLASFTLGLVLLAEVGGFGSFFNVFAIDEFRCYNRVSPFISLFSFGALALVFDRLLAFWPLLLRLSVVTLLLTFGAVDQIPLSEFSHRTSRERAFYIDQASIARVETLLPHGAMVFQLPDTPFPLDAGVNHMLPYDNARAYLHSHQLNWSWGSMAGRHQNWSHLTAQLPPRQFLDQIISSGFQGILLDKNGYKDGMLLNELTQRIGTPHVVPLDARWVFFDLRAFAHAPSLPVSTNDAKTLVRKKHLPIAVYEKPKALPKHLETKAID